MDHILSNMDNPIPAPGTESSTDMTSRKFEDDDMSDDDREALAAHIAKMGGKPGDADQVEAKSVKCSEVGCRGIWKRRGCR